MVFVSLIPVAGLFLSLRDSSTTVATLEREGLASAAADSDGMLVREAFAVLTEHVEGAADRASGLTSSEVCRRDLLDPSLQLPLELTFTMTFNDGQRLCSTAEDPTALEASIVSRVATTGREVTSHPFVADNGRLSFLIGAPITDATGRPVGVMTAQIPLSTFSALLTGRARNNDALTLLYDSDDRIILASSGGDPAASGRSFDLPADGTPGDDPSGTQRVFERSPIAIGDDAWVIASGIAVDHPVPAAAGDVTHFLPLLVTLLAIYLMIAAFIIRSVLREILALHRASRSIVNGERTIPLVPDGPPELRPIAEDFNAMMAARDRAVAHMHELEGSLSAVMEVETDAQVLTDEETVVYANTAASDLFGAPIRGEPVVRLLSRFGAGETSDQLRELFASSVPRTSVMTSVITVRDGEERTVQVSGRVWPNEARKIFHVLVRDVSDRLRYEEAALINAKMEGVGRLAASIAHDLRSVAGTVIGYGELLERHDDAIVSSRARKIIGGARRAEALARFLITMSRGRPLMPELLDLSVLVTENVITIDGLLHERTWIEQHLEAGPLPFIGDRLRFEQVIMNLVVNARDALLDGGAIEVSTRAAIMKDGRPAVELEVADHGQGMDEATKRRIFEAFFTTKPTGRGTGLGLTVVAEAVASMGGEISVTSAQGQGSSFMVRWPLADASLREDDGT